MQIEIGQMNFRLLARCRNLFRIEEGNPFCSAEIDFSFLALADRSFAEFIALQTIANVKVDKGFALDMHA